MMESLKGYRTVILNAVVLVTALAELVGALDLMTGGMITLSGWGAAVIAALSAANLFLRYLSDSPIFGGESKESTAIRTALGNAWASGQNLVLAVQAVLAAKTPAETLTLPERLNTDA